MDLIKIRTDFPILQRKINNNPLIYLDNAATTQIPFAVTDALTKHYSRHNGNAHRGIHTLSNKSAKMLEKARERITLF